MSVEIKPNSEIIIDFGLEEKGPAHYYFAGRCRARMNARYVPEDKGVLHDTSLVDSTDCAIIYYQPYASYQYYGIRKDGTHKVQKYSKPGTGPYWDKKMVSAEKDLLVEDMKDYIKGRGNK